MKLHSVTTCERCNLLFFHSIFTLQFFFFFFRYFTRGHLSCCWIRFKHTDSSQNAVIPLFRHYAVLLSPLCEYFSESLLFLLFFFSRRGLCHFPNDVCRGPNEWCFCLVFKDLLLCLREFPVFILFYRQLAESSFRPWSLWTGSVALIAQVIDQKESTVIPLDVLRDSCHWLMVGGRQGYVSVQSVYQYSFSLSCHLVDLAVLFTLVQRPVLNCIKLYRLCKKLNVA